MDMNDFIYLDGDKVKITLEENLRRLRRKKMQGNDIIRKFNGEYGMIIARGDLEPIVIYREGYDYLGEIKDEIKQVARPNEDEAWMYAPDHWDDDRVWDACMILDTPTRYMTPEELAENDDVHAMLGYRLVIKED